MKQQTIGATIRQHIHNYETQIIEIEQFRIYPLLVALVYIVASISLLIFLGIPHNQLDLTASSIATKNLYQVEQRTEAPYTFRWLAQDSEVPLPQPSNGKQIIRLMATVPLPNSHITISINNQNPITFPVAPNVFRRYEYLVDAPRSNETTQLRFHNDNVSQNGRELSIGLTQISMRPLTPYVIPRTPILLLILYTAIIVFVWRMEWHLVLTFYTTSMLFLAYAATHIFQSDHWYYAYLATFGLGGIIIGRSKPAKKDDPLVIPVYRHDVDGLRAVAIIAVVVYHAFPALLPNGNVGVDIFFVISGYLISQLLIRQFVKNTFSFSDFFNRRIRRIFPALLCMLLVVMIMGLLFLFPNEYAQLGRHIGAGAGFFANLLLYTEVNYFDKSAAYKPLLHLWSLGVEEQFYVMWPILLYLFRHRLRSVPALITTLIVASFLVNLRLDATLPIASFYWPMSRVWELLIGTLVVHILASPTVRQRLLFTPIIAHSISAVGIILLVASMFWAGGDASYTYYSAILPITGAILVIVAGERAWFNRIILANPVMVWIGLISFPLYLWHWPLLSFANFFTNTEPSIAMRIVLVAISVLLAWLTYAYLEKPLRQGALRSIPTRYFTYATFACGIVGYFLIGSGLIMPFNRNAPASEVSSSPAVVTNTPLCAGIENNYLVTCLHHQRGNDTTEEFVFIGDSHAEVLAAGNNIPHSTTAFAVHYCLPLLGAERFVDQSSRPFGCDDIRKLPAFINNLRANPPVHHRTIFIAGRFVALEPSSNIVSDRRGFYQFSGPRLDANTVNLDAVFQTGLQRTLTALTTLPNTSVVFIDQVPELDFMPMNCNRLQLFRSLAESNCTTPQPPIMQAFARYKLNVSAVLANFPTVRRYDPMQSLCHNNQCAIMTNGYALYIDTNHLTPYGASLVDADLWKKVLGVNPNPGS